MLTLLTSTLIASAYAETDQERRCRDEEKFFEDNQLLCENLLTKTPSIDGFSAAVEDTTEMAGRAADLSGCGKHRVCTECRDMTNQQCFWNPGTGCVKRAANNFAASVCNAQTNLAPQCEAFPDCKSCTIQNGCIFFQGRCTYSKGTGCQNDPANCINYEWNCPAFPPPQVVPPPIYSPPAVYQPPQAVGVYTPTVVYNPPVVNTSPSSDRVYVIAQRFSDMITGLNAQELRQLKVQVEQRIESAIVTATPSVYNPWANNNWIAPMPSAPIYSAPTNSAPANWWNSAPANWWETTEPTYAYTPIYTPTTTTNWWDTLPASTWG